MYAALWAIVFAVVSPQSAPLHRLGRAFTAATVELAEQSAAREIIRDLSKDEAEGGHTLSRHVGRTDAQLAERLRREPQISSASTYTDRSTAEQIVGAAIAAGGNRLLSWQRRSGRRPNLVLNYVTPDRKPIGRSLSRGQPAAVECFRALVVLQWNERTNRWHVLTSYPESGR